MSIVIILSAIVIISQTDSVEALSRQGSQGSEVRLIQQKLSNLGFYKGTIDGVFGTNTKNAVIAFQKSKGLVADGVAGTATLRALGVNTTTYRNGSSGDVVRQIQTKLKAWGYYTGTVDGQYGWRTQNAVSYFQRKNNLTADGVAGPATLAALGINPTASAPAANKNTDLLARAVSAEARGEPYAGQVAVAAVILNRTKHPSFPSTISGVIYQPGAFSSVPDGQINQAPTESARRAASDALNGYDPSYGALYFYNPAKATNQWIRSLPVSVVIGSHIFCHPK